ncbi:hypothetical protein [Bacillus clarus]
MKIKEEQMYLYGSIAKFF